MKHALAIFIDCILFFFFLKTSAQSNEQRFPCVIIIHNNREINSRNYSLTQRDKFGLEGHGLMNAFADPPPYSLDTSKSDDAVFNIFITEPTSIYIGYNEIYIQPKDTIELATAGNNPELFSLQLKRGISFFLNEVGKKSRFQIINDSISRLPLFKNKTAYSSLSFFNNLAKKITEKMASENLMLKKSEGCLNFIRTYSFEYNISSYIAHFLHPHLRTPDLDNNIVLSDSLKSFLINYSKQTGLLKTVYFWTTFSNVAKYYLPQLKKNSFNYDVIKKIIQPYDTDVQQFFLLKWLQEYNYIVRKDTANYKEILGQITYPAFLPLKNQFESKKLARAQDYISKALQNALIYDFQYRKIKFNDLFRNAKQPFIIFDFCGSWCGPCIKEIETYSKNKILDTSHTLRPIWLFFENDSTKWQTVVLKYGLKKENCFLMLDPNFPKNFGAQYDWRNEYPHHSIFRNDGSIVKNAAQSLSDFNESEIKKLE